MLYESTTALKLSHKIIEQQNKLFIFSFNMNNAYSDTTKLILNSKQMIERVFFQRSNGFCSIRYVNDDLTESNMKVLSLSVFVDFALLA